MRRFCVAAAAAAVLMTGMLMAQIPTPTIVKKSPALDALIAPDAVFEKLGEGFRWTEGPVWSKKGGFLLFSDIPNNVINKWEPGKGAVGVPEAERLPRHGAVHRPRAGHQRAHLRCPGPARRLPARRSTGGAVGERNVDSRSADKYEGKRLNSPNDLVFHSSGALYFTDPPYGLPKRWDDPAKELPFQGVYRLAHGRQADAADQGDQRAQRHRLLAGREDALRRAVRSREGDLDGVSGQGRRHARRGQGVRWTPPPTSRPRSRACPTA